MLLFHRSMISSNTYYFSSLTPGAPTITKRRAINLALSSHGPEPIRLLSPPLRRRSHLPRRSTHSHLDLRLLRQLLLHLRCWLLLSYPTGCLVCSVCQVAAVLSWCLLQFLIVLHLGRLLHRSTRTRLHPLLAVDLLEAKRIEEQPSRLSHRGRRESFAL